jgi:type I restriction modification DNA specificity domain protein
MRHEKYKDCGMEWIGGIPVHWDLIKYKYFANLYTGNSIPDEEKYIYEEVDEGFSYISTKDVGIDRTIDYDNGMLIPFSNKKFKVAPQNSTIMCIEGGSAGIKKAFLDMDVCFGNKLCCFDVKAVINKKYVYYLLNSPDYEQYFKLHVNGLIGGVSVQILKNFLALQPPIDEQNTIVKYLDDETSKIDSIIKNLESEKEKLEVYKREIIAEAVTKGLKSNIPMKDSGVDWMGEVPEHWEVKKIKWIFKILKRKNGRDDRQVLSITQQGIKIKNIENNDGQMAESYENYQLVEPGDFAMNSMDLLTGWIDCSQYEGVTSPDYRVFRLIDINDHNNDFYNYLFQMCYTRRIFYRIGQGVSNLGRWRLQREPFLNMKIPVPPKEEQENISSFIRIKENKINVIVNEVEKQIEKLKEHRKILIHEAVTGKVKIDGGAK